MRKIKKSVAIVTLLIFLFSVIPTFAKDVEKLDDKYDLLKGLGFFSEEISSSQWYVNNEFFVLTLEKAIPRPERYNIPKNTQELTLNNALKVILDMMSYNLVYENQGVIKTASNIGLLKNISFEEKLTFSSFVNLIYNALDIKILYQTEFGDKNRFDTYENKTFLTQVLEIEKAVGIIEGNENTMLSYAHDMNDDIVIINSEKFSVGNSMINHFLGQKMKYYYRYNEDKSEKTILYADSGNYNEILKLTHSDIKDYKNGAYIYEKNAKSCKQKVDKIADVIYNGKAITLPFSDYKPKNGTVELIDNNNDGYSDVVKITQYYNLTVKTVNKKSYEIIDKYDGKKNIVVNPANSQIKYKITDEKGKGVSLFEIKEWDILSVAKSIDENLINIIVSHNKVSGILKEKSSEIIVVDNIEYKYSGIINGDVGDYGVFYLDCNNIITAFDKLKSGTQTSGYLVGVQKSGVLDGTLKLKIFDENGKFTVYKTTSKIKIDDVVETDLGEAENRILANGEEQLILYKINNNGEVYEINLAQNYSKDLNTKGFRQENPPKTKYAHKSYNFSNAFRQDPLKTKVYLIPEDKTQEEQFVFYKEGKDYFKFNTYYYVTSYSVSDELPYVEYVVVHLDSAGSNDFDTKLMILENVTQTINKKGEETRNLYGFHNFQKVCYMLKPTNALTATDFNSGDIIKIRQNDAGEIVAASKLYDGKVGKIIGSNPSSKDAMAEYRHLFASVYSAKGGTLFITTKNVEDVTTKEDGEYAFSDLYASIYRYDVSQKKIYEASSSEIKNYISNFSDYSKVFIYHHYADPEFMVIFD